MLKTLAMADPDTLHTLASKGAVALETPAVQQWRQDTSGHVWTAYDCGVVKISDGISTSSSGPSQHAAQVASFEKTFGITCSLCMCGIPCGDKHCSSCLTGGSGSGSSASTKAPAVSVPAIDAALGGITVSSGIAGPLEKLKFSNAISLSAFEQSLGLSSPSICSPSISSPGLSSSGSPLLKVIDMTAFKQSLGISSPSVSSPGHSISIGSPLVKAIDVSALEQTLRLNSPCVSIAGARSPCISSPGLSSSSSGSPLTNAIDVAALEQTLGIRRNNSSDSNSFGDNTGTEGCRAGKAVLAELQCSSGGGEPVSVPACSSGGALLAALQRTSSGGKQVSAPAGSSGSALLAALQHRPSAGQPVSAPACSSGATAGRMLLAALQRRPST
jgi:hypothetical protein